MVLEIPSIRYKVLTPDELKKMHNTFQQQIKKLIILHVLSTHVCAGVRAPIRSIDFSPRDVRPYFAQGKLVFA